MMTYAGELDYPTDEDVKDAIEVVADHFKASKIALADRFHHWYGIADFGWMPPIEARG
jgi:hypothetical protein